MCPKVSSCRQVAVLVDSATDWGRRLIGGITNYANQQGPWQLFVEPRGRSDPMKMPRDWQGDGIIARVTSDKMAAELGRRKVPVVNISGIELTHDFFPRVATDYDAVARLAVEHFRSRGFQRFAYVGPIGSSYVKTHADAFETACESESAIPRFNYAHESIASNRWLAQKNRLANWLDKLPKPVAVFGWGTSAPCQIIHLCNRIGIHVPDSVSVLAGDNDDLIARTTVPHMSAVITPSAQIGFRAARLLEQQMNRSSRKTQSELISPIEIVTRASTDALAIEDPELLDAVRFLREHAFSELTIQAVADAVPMTRRSLERKFMALLDRTPLAELRRLRIARVKELLATTDLSMSRVAMASGFGTPEYMATIFKRESNLTPLKYRSVTRAR